MLATLVAWAAFRVIAHIPDRVRARQLSGTADDLVDLAEDVDPERDHVRGAPDAPVTLVEYGDYQCPYCGQAEVVIRELLDSFGDELRYVWRHLPLNDVHANAQLAAEAAEAAAAQGEFWAYHDRLLADQEDLSPRELGRHAAELGLDTTRFWSELQQPRARGPDRRRRGDRGRQRRRRHAVVLHQRPALRRGVRRGDADAGGQDRAAARAGAGRRARRRGLLLALLGGQELGERADQLAREALGVQLGEHRADREVRAERPPGGLLGLVPETARR